MTSNPPSAYYLKELEKIKLTGSQPSYPLGAYCIFSQERRQLLKVERPKLGQKKVFQIIKKEWKSLPDKQSFKERAQNYYEEYLHLMDFWDALETSQPMRPASQLPSTDPFAQLEMGEAPSKKQRTDSEGDLAGSIQPGVSRSTSQETLDQSPKVVPEPKALKVPEPSADKKEVLNVDQGFQTKISESPQACSASKLSPLALLLRRAVQAPKISSPPPQALFSQPKLNLSGTQSLRPLEKQPSSSSLSLSVMSLLRDTSLTREHTQQVAPPRLQQSAPLRIPTPPVKQESATRTLLNLLSLQLKREEEQKVRAIEAESARIERIAYFDHIAAALVQRRPHNLGFKC